MGSVATSELRQETYLPDNEGLEAIYECLHAQPRPLRCTFIGANPNETVELPVEVYRVLRQVVEAMRQGLAVTVAPQSLTMTTQQAADLLGISRPTLIRRLDEGLLPFERVGTHRKILLRDVLKYREERREQQYEALARMGDYSDDDDIQETLDSLRKERARLAAERRQRHLG